MSTIQHQPLFGSYQQPLIDNAQESAASSGPLSIPTRTSPSLSALHRQSIIKVHHEPEIGTPRQPPIGNAQESAASPGPLSVPTVSTLHQQPSIEAHPKPEVGTHHQPIIVNAQRPTAGFGPLSPLTIIEALGEISGNARRHHSYSPMTLSERTTKQNQPKYVLHQIPIVGSGSWGVGCSSRQPNGQSSRYQMPDQLGQIFTRLANPEYGDPTSERVIA